MTGERFHFSVEPQADGKRLDVFLAAALAAAGQKFSREKVKESIRRGEAVVDGEIAPQSSRKLKAGQSVALHAPAVPDASIRPEEGCPPVLYADADIVVVDKPAGLTVHPAPAEPVGTLVQKLASRFPQLAAPEESGLEGQRPGVVHRIDKDTSGLLLVALNEKARSALAADFAARRVSKEYLCLVHGRPAQDEGTMDAPIGRHPTQKVKMAVTQKGGKPALSRWRLLHAGPNNAWSLLAVAIHTGRTHQIRVHLAHMGHPLVGDRVYGPAAKADPLFTPLAQRQMLHAWRLGIVHPASGKPVQWRLPPPKDFLQTALHLDRLASGRPQQVVVTGMPGCGKSSLMKQLSQAGVPTWSADAAVEALYEPGGDGHAYIRSRFGERFAGEGQPVDKPALFAAMQNDSALRREIMDAVHPMVYAKLKNFWAAHARARVAVAEIPLYFESAAPDGPAAAAGITVGVYCPARLRKERLAAARGWPETMFATMESWQWPEDVKMRACDLIVDNADDMDALDRRGRSLLRVLGWLRRRRTARLAAKLERIFQGAE